MDRFRFTIPLLMAVAFAAASCSRIKPAPTKMVQIVKSLTARELFKRVPSVKKQLWGGEFWSKGYFISTVGRHGSEEVIRRYVKHQGTERDYKQLHSQAVQMELW